MERDKWIHGRVFPPYSSGERQGVNRRFWSPKFFILILLLQINKACICSQMGVRLNFLALCLPVHVDACHLPTPPFLSLRSLVPSIVLTGQIS